MANADTDRLAAKRPLSPHLSVYQPMLTMMMSIAHRITGAGLYVAALLLAFYFLGAAFGGGLFSLVSWIGCGLIAFLFAWAVFHHLLGGVRHALWDRGLYMDPVGRELLARGTLFGGVGLAVALWIVATLAG